MSNNIDKREFLNTLEHAKNVSIASSHQSSGKADFIDKLIFSIKDGVFDSKTETSDSETDNEKSEETIINEACA